MEFSPETKKNNVEILIAEDSATQVELLKHLLEDHGYTAAVASNGKQALAMTRKRKPALVISDIVMPEMDGYELCKAIKSAEELRNIPVLLLTSLADSEEILKALECGADNFVRKPYDDKRILQQIEYVLTSSVLHETEKMHLGLKIEIGGKRHFITSE